jgi:hypothetical protein
VRAHRSRPARAPSTSVMRARAPSLMPINQPVQISINKRARQHQASDALLATPPTPGWHPLGPDDELLLTLLPDEEA